jgi:hypothetical protein
VLALCTSEAKEESWPLLREGLGQRIQARAVDLPADPSDLRAFLSTVAGAHELQSGAALTVDATHGWRHYAFLTYLAALYLSALRGNEVRGAYYGLLQEGESRLLDLRPLLELPRWIHALRVFADTGSARPLADLLGGVKTQRIARDLRELSLAHGTGLPLELGRLSSDFIDQHARTFQRLLSQEHALPLAEELTSLFKERLESFRLTDTVPGAGWKGKVSLSEEELKRQARLVDELLEGGSLATALGLMREWTVSWAILRLRLDGQWLDRDKVRRRAEGVLGALRALLEDSTLGGLTQEQKQIANFWKLLSDLRNAFLHSGMRRQVLAPPDSQLQKTIKEIQSYWSDVLRRCPAMELMPVPGTAQPLLISPIGLRPGVLSSALRACAEEEGPPGTCLVICSRETEGSIPRALEQAGYQGPVERLLLEDPFGGQGEIKRLVQASRSHLLQAERVCVNITGGTTLMGLVVEAIAGQAGQMARAVRRFGLIDRRPAAEQDAEPFQPGEAFWLDAEGGAHGGGD